MKAATVGWNSSSDGTFGNISQRQFLADAGYYYYEEYGGD